MRFHWQISAGELFEAVRPAAFVLSVLLSTWVLMSARRVGFRLYSAATWALAAFFLPIIVLPIYFIVRHTGGRRVPSLAEDESPASETSSPNLPASVSQNAKQGATAFRPLVPAVYCVVMLGLTLAYLYHDYTAVDGHLARAAQRKLSGDKVQAIREYRAALALEDTPHTHKLLGIELADARLWPEALNEFRAAERGGEPDDRLVFLMAEALEKMERYDEAMLEYRRFLATSACFRVPAADSCLTAKQRISKGQGQTRP